MRRRLFIAAMLPAIAMLCAGAMASPGIKPFDSDGMRRILAHAAGRPFVMMVWSLDCTYCHASMTNLAAATARPDFDIVPSRSSRPTPLRPQKPSTMPPPRWGHA